MAGIVVRKERWGLSWRGWLILFAGTAILFGLCLLRIYPFLAVTRPVNADALVVEGWVHEYAIRAAVEEFKQGSYRRVFTTGGPVEGIGHYVNDYQTTASVGAELLKKYGLSDEVVEMVPSRVMDRDRTYASAIALGERFRREDIGVRSINVVTEDVHARRTQLLFQEALGPQFAVGIIAVRNPDYDPEHWWQYSQGVKDVVSEGVAYAYVKCFYWPGQRSK